MKNMISCYKSSTKLIDISFIELLFFLQHLRINGYKERKYVLCCKRGVESYFRMITKKA